MVQFPRISFLPLASRPDLPPPAAQQPRPSAAPQPFGSASAFVPASSQGTTLRTERLGDGSANCLEKAVGLARPGDSLVLLGDARDGVGHALVRRPDGSVTAPNHPAVRYETLGQWQALHPQYSNPVAVPAAQVRQVLSTPPGERRDALIATLGLSGVANRAVADGERWVTPTVTANVRSDAGTSYRSIGGVKRGDLLQVVKANDDGTWLQVKLPDGKLGWVSASVLKDTDPPAPPRFPSWMVEGSRPPDVALCDWNELSQAGQEQLIQARREEAVAKAWPLPEFDVNGPPPPDVSPLVWNHLPAEGKQALYREEWSNAVREQTALLFDGVPKNGVAAEHPFLGVDSALGHGRVDEWLEYAATGGSAAQYLNLQKMFGEGWIQAHNNLCGPLAVGASLDMLPKEALTVLLGPDGDSSASWNVDDSIQYDKLAAMYASEGWTTHYVSGDTGAMLMPRDFARDLEAGKSLVALVNIDTAGDADGMLRPMASSTKKVAHWVNVRAVEEDAQGNWMVRVYNPIQNREELYSWEDFKASWDSTAGNSGHGLLTATPPEPTAP